MTPEIKEIVRQLRNGSDPSHKILRPLLERAAEALERLSLADTLHEERPLTMSMFLNKTDLEKARAELALSDTSQDRTAK